MKNAIEYSSYFDMQLKLDYVIDKALRENVFTACSLGFFKLDNGSIKSKILNYGRTSFGLNENTVSEKTIFDLASLTKPLVVSLLFLILQEKGMINIEDNLDKFFKKKLDLNKRKIKIEHLLTHTSGLPAHRPYYKILLEQPVNERMIFIIDKILSENLCFEPGKGCLYSDLGFILAGYLIELVSGQKLDYYFIKKISEVLSLQDELFFNRNNIIDKKYFVETGRCSWSGMNLKGLVNDENCRALGGVAGHAGLFGTVKGLLKYLEVLNSELTGLTKIFEFNSKNINIFLTRKKQSNWVNGFDTPSKVSSSSGKYFSNFSLGHLGFTGTSFWLDIKMGIGVVLLTNRVICSGNSDSIKKFRPLIHNIIMESIKNKNIPESL